MVGFDTMQYPHTSHVAYVQVIKRRRKGEKKALSQNQEKIFILLDCRHNVHIYQCPGYLWILLYSTIILMLTALQHLFFDDNKVQLYSILYWHNTYDIYKENAFKRVKLLSKMSWGKKCKDSKAVDWWFSVT